MDDLIWLLDDGIRHGRIDSMAALSIMVAAAEMALNGETDLTLEKVIANLEPPPFGGCKV